MQYSTPIFDKEIKFSFDTQYYTQIPDVYPIPSKTIIHKTVTGIGATYGEVIDQTRNSIIVLPNVAVVRSKDLFHRSLGHNTIAVYGDVDYVMVNEYLVNSIGFKKIFTTPKGLEKIIKATIGVDFRDIFFLLIDECHKVIQEAGYRDDMVPLMDRFFQFTNKALISATPIAFSDARFKKENFKHIKLTPDYVYKKPINLIKTNSVTNALKEYIEVNPSRCYCIFFNSIDGILSLIKHLKLKKDVKIFCSEESSLNLKKNGFNYTRSVYDSYAKYNFFTSSFFNGLDIVIEDTKPNIVMISDCQYPHTILDPFSDVLQIIGRFRQKDKNNHVKATHINNASRWVEVIDEDALTNQIANSKHAFEVLNGLKASIIETDIVPYIDQAIKTIKPYYNLLDKKGCYSSFLEDNYFNDLRVKRYYKNQSTLKTAYVATKLYSLHDDATVYEKEEILNLHHHHIRHKKEVNKYITDLLSQLEDIKGSDLYVLERLKIQRAHPEVLEGFDRLGKQELTNLKFGIRKIKKALLKLDIEEKKNSYPLINKIYQKFQVNRSYLCSEIKPMLQKIYKELDMDKKAFATDLEYYFLIRKFNKSTKDESCKPKSNRAYQLIEHKSNPAKLSY